MAFIVEDGTGKPDANSYVSLAEADDYFLTRGNTEWTGTDAEKEGALVRATDYLDGRYGLRFIGEKASQRQALAWPRKDAEPYFQTEIPPKLRRACCELGLRALKGELVPDPQIDASGFRVFATRKKVGPIETQFAVPMGVGMSAYSALPEYPAVELYLSGLLKFSRRVVRA